MKQIPNLFNKMVITPNRRLCKTVRQIANETQLANGFSTFESPSIFALNDWQREFYSNVSLTSLEPLPTLLSSTQSDYIWQKIVVEMPEFANLIQLSETAALMASAHELLTLWDIRLTEADCDQYADYLLTVSCITAFEDYLAQNNFITECELPRYLQNFSWPSEFHPEIILIGFNEIAPLHQKLFNHLSMNGITITHQNAPRHEDPRCTLVKTETIQHQYLAMAHWAKTQLHLTVATQKDDGGLRLEAGLNEDGGSAFLKRAAGVPLGDGCRERRNAEPPSSFNPASNLNPPSSSAIACIVPNLTTHRDEIIAAFEEVFYGTKRFDYDKKSCPFNVSGGSPLRHYPIIESAMQLLRIDFSASHLATKSLLPLLQSPWFGDYYDERLQRESFSLFLHSMNIAAVPITREAITKAQFENHTLERHANKFYSRLKTCMRKTLLLPKQQSIADWTLHFADLLHDFAWPGDRTLESLDYQLVEAWLSALEQLKSIASIDRDAISKDSAYHILDLLLKNTVFQSKTPDAPIQILGLLEGAGIPFSKVWMTDMDDFSWPPKNNPHPFIPKKIQKAYNMPHASAERELEYCRTILKQYQSSTSQLIYSYAEKNEHAHQSPSAFVLHHPVTSISRAILENETLYTLLCENTALEWRSNTHARAFLPQEAVTASATLVKTQAECPFKAFAIHRLHARSMTPPKDYLSYEEKGLILHQSIARIWGILQHHQGLLSLTESSLSRLILQTLTTIFNTHMRYLLKNKDHLRLEKKRFFRIMKDWFRLERQRESFRVVGHEISKELPLNKLTITCRIDRIDELNDGSQFVIDYKTSKVATLQSFFKERIQDPQLLLYLFTDPGLIKQFAYAELTTKRLGFHGISATSAITDGVHPIKKFHIDSFTEQQHVWKTQLEQLAMEFLEGFAEPKPLLNANTCRSCHLQSLCRINELVKAQDDETI